jgi:hypothetical protein
MSHRVSWAATAAMLLCLVGCDSDFMVSRDLGARCERHADCHERCLVDVDADTGHRYPDGFCTVSCDGDGDCPAGAVCAAIEGGVCLFACEQRESCAFLGTGWDCVPESGQISPAEAQPHEVHVCLGQ